MLDAHAHLTSPPAQPHPAGIVGWIVPGVDLKSEVLAAQLDADDSRIHAALGLHPWHLPESPEALQEQLEQLGAAAAARRPCAIGETGLDKGWRAAPRPIQLQALRGQVQLAVALELPLILHCVRSHGACLSILREEGLRTGGMVHDFCGPPEMIPDWLDAGFLLSISPRGMDHDAVTRAIPGEALLLETDDAGPELLPSVCARLAEARGLSPEELARQTEANARRLFRLGPRRA